MGEELGGGVDAGLLAGLRACGGRGGDSPGTLLERLDALGRWLETRSLTLGQMRCVEALAGEAGHAR